MSYANDTITAPIAASDPYYLLGIGQYNGGYDIGYVCSNNHGKINKWSRRKPIRNSSIDELADNDFTAANFGLELPTYSNNFKTAINNATYNYLPPRGGDSEPYRLTDFEHYRSTTKPPCQKCADLSFKDYSASGVFNISVILNQMGHDNYNIGLDEFPMFADKYLAVVIEYSDGRGHTVTIWKTAEQTIGNQGYSVTFDDLQDRFRTAKYYICAASKKQSQQTSDMSYTDFYGLPFNQPSEASANISITSANPLSVRFIGCSSSATGSNVILAGDAVPGGLSFGINSSTGLWAQAEITGNDHYVLQVKDIVGEFRPCCVYGTATNSTSTTGKVPMDVYELNNGIWTKVTNNIQFFAGTKKTLRFGKADWAWYNNGVREYNLKSSFIYDTGSIWVTDKNTGYGLAGMEPCRIGLFG